MIVALLVMVSTLWYLPSLTNAFVPVPQRLHDTRAGSLHYFDDASRYYSVEWHPADEEAALRFQQQKMAAIKRRILGHDAISASKLNSRDVKKSTKAWAHKAGVIGGKTATAATTMMTQEILYQNMAGMAVCRNNDILGCLAFYWRRIVKLMRDGDGDLNNKRSFVYMVVFPYCKDLYSYETFQLLNMAVDLGQPSEASLTMFHPKYKNAPSIFSPERHSPFPTAGLIKKKESGYDFLDDSRFLDNQRVRLERLYNSAAALNTEASIGDELQSMDHTYLPANEVVEMTKAWFDVTTAQNSGDRWFVSDATVGEEAYADIFTIIHNLYLLGLDTPKGETLSSVVVAPYFCPYNAQQWRHFCITVNAVLKKMGKGKLYVEVYHPEYSQDDARRSPFATIQIVFQA